LNKIQTLWIHYYVIWAEEYICNLSMINQQYIMKISWWLCDHVSEWYIDIFRKSWNTLQTCAKDTEKVKRENFVCETVKKQIWDLKS